MPNYDNIDLSNMIIDGDPYGEFEEGGGGSFDPNSLSTSTNVPVDADEIVTGENGTWYRKAFSKVWDYIKSKIQASSNEVAYGTCSTAAATATKAVTLDTAGNWVLKKGCRVCVKFTNTNTFSATAESPCKLNVNNTGAKNIYWGGSGNPTGTNTTAFGRANYINEYVYDGTYWVWCGSSADNNTTYSNMSTSEMTTGTATSARTMRADYLKAGLSALCPFKFYSSWTYKVEIVSSTGSGQTTWIYTPQGYIILNTSGSKINLSNVHVSNASKWTYTRDSNNNLKITLNCTDHTPMFIFASDNNIEVSFTDTSTPQTNSISNSGYSGVDSSKLPLVGGTMAGRIVSAKPNKLIITGTGTAGQDKGSEVSPRYFPAKWTYDTGITAENGDIINIKLPVAGHDYGVYVSIDNGTTYYPVVLNGTTRLTTQFGNGTNILLQLDTSASAANMFAINGGDNRTTVTGGAWRVINYYDANNYVRQYPTSDNKEYRVLFSTNANDNDETNFIRKDADFKYNPSANTLTVGKIANGAKVNFTSDDTTDANATSWTSVTKVDSATDITFATFFQRITQMFKNVRYLYNKLNETNTAESILYASPTTEGVYQNYTLSKSIANYKLLIFEPRFYSNVYPSLTLPTADFRNHAGSGNRLIYNIPTDIAVYYISDTQVSIYFGAISNMHFVIWGIK